MKQTIFDEEIRLECSCGDPFEFVHFGFDGGRPSGYEQPELYVQFRAWHGSFWRRLKEAVKLIRSGWTERYADCLSIGMDEVEKLRDFCNKCIEREASHGKDVDGRRGQGKGGGGEVRYV